MALQIHPHHSLQPGLSSFHPFYLSFATNFLEPLSRPTIALLQAFAFLPFLRPLITPLSFLLLHLLPLGS